MDAHLAYGELRRDPWFLDLAARCWRSRGIGDFLMFCLLADGVVDVGIGHDGDRLWDLAAPRLVVQEAGGCLTDPAGRPWAEGRSRLPATGCCTRRCWPPSHRQPPRTRHGQPGSRRLGRPDHPRIPSWNASPSRWPPPIRAHNQEDRPPNAHRHRPCPSSFPA